MKRVLSILLCLVMLAGLTVTLAFAETAGVTAFVNAEENEEISEGTEGNDEIADEDAGEEVLPDACITVPQDAELFVGTKGRVHFVSFTEIPSAKSVSDGIYTKYYFELEDNSTYNYRVSGENYVTYGGTFKKTPDFSLDVTEEQLMPEGKSRDTVDRDTASNNGYNVADIYLNINPQGHLKLSENDTFQIVSLRNWEAVNSTTANYFIEPDYSYEVIDENGNPSDVAEIDKNGLLTAKNRGTAIVLVKYDAMTLNYGSGDSFYGAIYPENTGVFVLSVGEEESGIETGMTLNEGKNRSEIKLSGDYIDSEHDCIYYKGEKGSYTFTPVTEDVSVSVANPSVAARITYNGFEEVTANSDGSFSVPLETGRNIVKLTKDGKSEYQVITAKKVSVTVNGGETVHPGDSLSIVFDKLYHPANKLAGVYNMNAIAVYADVTGYEGKLTGAASAQYNFANNTSAQTVSNVLKGKNVWGLVSYVKDTDLIIPADYDYDTFTLSGGMVYASGWGDSYGNHRAITYENGKGVNLNADAKTGFFGKLPDIEIPVVKTSSALSSITLNTDNVKTSYFAGDKFDKTGLVVTAGYEDGATQTALNYTVLPEILTAGTEKVTVSYCGMSADIPVTVTEPKVTAIEITAPPSKTVYNAGETFSPSGMVVTAVYENGAIKETTEYSYSTGRELQAGDTEIVITYTGEDASENPASASQTITVTEASSGGGSSVTNTIPVYFTLLGDDKHGEPSGSSDTHTKFKNNLDVWVARTRITIEKGSFVIDAIEKALGLNGIPYTKEDNYISKVKGLAEFDNGSLSGWMYMLNGSYPTKGIDEQTLNDGDSLIFHYTDDYTAERTDFSTGSASPSASSSSSSVKKEKETEETKETEAAPEQEKPAEKVFDEKTYTDVKKSDWHYEVVKYVYENNLMNGTGTGFEPESKMSRAMLVTVLYRMENSEAKNKHGFIDVPEGEWYSDAVAWAAEYGIVNGVGGNSFDPDGDVSREQLALIIYRYAKLKGYDVSASAKIAAYTDAGEISEWAADALKWASAAELVNGMSDSVLAPKGTATRAQVAAILMRFCENIAK